MAAVYEQIVVHIFYAEIGGIAQLLKLHQFLQYQKVFSPNLQVLMHCFKSMCSRTSSSSAFLQLVFRQMVQKIKMVQRTVQRTVPSEGSGQLLTSNLVYPWSRETSIASNSLEQSRFLARSQLGFPMSKIIFESLF